MKTHFELRQMEKAAVQRADLAHMREQAMNYRMALAPDAGGSLTTRGEAGVFSLKLAISYRDMARDLGKWAKGEV